MAFKRNDDLLTLADVAYLIGAPRYRIKEYFRRGRPLEFVPRPQDPKARWLIRKKDFVMSLARYEEKQFKSSRRWDNLFEQDNLFELDAFGFDVSGKGAR
jgi:hypothetical protein